jgi:Txe/YoeB family toxin of Txe-Axe toxin-antitoxin module
VIPESRHGLDTCALPVNLNDEYTREMELEKENRELKLRHEQEMNQQFTTIMSMIQQNPLLAHIKPEALTKKTKEQIR